MRLVSEKLEKKFGGIRLEVIFQNRLARASCFYRTSDGEAVSYHIVAFKERGIKALGRAHGEIVKGGWIGEVIKKSGVPYERIVSKRSLARMTPALKRLFHSRRDSCATEKIEYKVKGVRYAVIREFYNPEYVPAGKAGRPIKALEKR